MTTFAADDFAAIAARMREIAAGDTARIPCLAWTNYVKIGCDLSKSASWTAFHVIRTVPILNRDGHDTGWTMIAPSITESHVHLSYSLGSTEPLVFRNASPTFTIGTEPHGQDEA